MALAAVGEVAAASTAPGVARAKGNQAHPVRLRQPDSIGAESPELVSELIEREIGAAQSRGREPSTLGLSVAPAHY